MADFTFTLSFAGVPFVSDTAAKMHPAKLGDVLENSADKFRPLPDLLDELDRIIPFRYGKDWAYPATTLSRNTNALALRTSPGNDCVPDIKISEWYYPTTASRWSVFRGLATSTQTRLMLAACGVESPIPPSSQTGAGLTFGQFKMQAVPVQLNEDLDADEYTLETEMYMLPPRPLAEHGGDYDGLYLITLVDSRYYMQGTPVSLRVNHTTKWVDLLRQLSTALNIDINGLTTDFMTEAAYMQPEIDSQLWSTFESAPALLDAVAANVGRVVVRELDGTYSLLTATQSQQRVILNRGDVANLLRTAGGDFFSSGTRLRISTSGLLAARNAVVPENVTVAFPPYIVGNDPVPHFLNARYRNQRPSAWFEDAHGEGYGIVVPISSGGPFVSGVIGIGDVTIHDTAKALHSGEIQFMSGNNCLNHSGLAFLARQVAEDFYSWRVAVALDEVYPGTYAWDPDGHHDIVWTYSTRRRLATTRVFRSPWTEGVLDFQHSTPPHMSGFTNTPVGVGGPSVAQTIRDSYTASGTFIGASGSSGGIATMLYGDLLSGATQAYLLGIDFFPTYNRWRGKISNPPQTASGVLSGFVQSGYISGSTSGLTVEYVLFEGTSGGTGGVGPFLIDMVYRAIDGTSQPLYHPSGSIISQVLPDTTYGVNLVTHEMMQFQYPQEWTSGGIQGTRIVPQTQSVLVLDGSGKIITDTLYFSGLAVPYDASQGLSGNWISGGDLIWIFERNNPPVAGSGLLRSGPLSGGFLSGFFLSGAYYSGSAYSGMTFSGAFFSGMVASGRFLSYPQSGSYYDGQILGYTASPSGLYIKSAPIYGINLGLGETSFIAQLTKKVYESGRLGIGKYISYSWVRTPDSKDPVPITWSDQYTASGGSGAFPAYQVRDLDLPAFPMSGTDIQTSGILNSGLVINSGPVPIQSGYFNSGIYSGSYLSGYIFPGGIAIKSMVRMRKGTGDYYFFEEEPWQDLFRRGDTADEYGIIGFTRIWNQNTRAWEDGDEVRIVFAE